MSQLDLVGSIAIGGFVLIMLLGLYVYFDHVSRSTVMSEVQQTTITEFGKVIEHDFNKMGYRVMGGNKILFLDSTRISFLGDLNDDGAVDSVTYTKVNMDQGVNLIRYTSLDASKSFTMPLVDFSFQAFDSTGSMTNNPGTVQSIQINLLLEKRVETSDTKEKLGAYWIRRIVPKNL
jgi:hypothetical protein